MIRFLWYVSVIVLVIIALDRSFQDLTIGVFKEISVRSERAWIGASKQRAVILNFLAESMKFGSVPPAGATASGKVQERWGFFYKPGYELRFKNRQYNGNCWQDPEGCNPRIGIYVAYSNVIMMELSENSTDKEASQNACRALIATATAEVLKRKNLFCRYKVHWLSFNSEEEADNKLTQLLTEIRRSKIPDQKLQEYYVDSYKFTTITRIHYDIFKNEQFSQN